MWAIDVVACEAGFWVCSLESWASEPTTWLMLGGILVGCTLLVWLQWRYEMSLDEARQRPRPARTPRVVAGPELRDGSWVRLVEYAPGQRRAELYSDRRWVVLHRDPSKFFEAAPRDELRLPSR